MSTSRELRPRSNLAAGQRSSPVPQPSPMLQLRRHDLATQAAMLAPGAVSYDGQRAALAPIQLQTAPESPQAAGPGADADVELAPEELSEPSPEEFHALQPSVEEVADAVAEAVGDDEVVFDDEVQAQSGQDVQMNEPKGHTMLPLRKAGLKFKRRFMRGWRKIFGGKSYRQPQGRTARRRSRTPITPADIGKNWSRQSDKYWRTIKKWWDKSEFLRHLRKFLKGPGQTLYSIITWVKMVIGWGSDYNKSKIKQYRALDKRKDGKVLGEKINFGKH